MPHAFTLTSHTHIPTTQPYTHAPTHTPTYTSTPTPPPTHTHSHQTLVQQIRLPSHLNITHCIPTGCAVAIVMTIVLHWVESINYTVKQLKLREQASFPICTRFSLASMLKLCMAGFVPRSHAGVGLRFWGWGCKQTCDFQFWTRCLRKIVYVRVTSSALQIINPLNSASRLQ